MIVGVDETKDGFNIFFALENRGPSQFMLTQLDDSLVERLTTKLPIVDRSQTIYSCRLGVSRSFRLRNLKSGEVTKYFSDIATQSRYIDMGGRLPFRNLPTRLSYANKLSAAETPSHPEIIIQPDRRANAGWGFLLFDQQANYFYEPEQMLTDAIFDDERRLVVTRSASPKLRHYRMRLIRLSRRCQNVLIQSVYWLSVEPSTA